MNVNTITVGKETALAKLAEYRTLNRRQIQPEDTRLRQLYRAVSKGARVVNVLEAFKAAGLNEHGQPKLAIARADWRTVYFHPSCCITWNDDHTQYDSKQYRKDAGVFTDTDQFHEWAYRKTISFTNTFADNLDRKSIRSAVPHIPPSVRPTIALSNFHILFEVEKWETYPVDPFLLRHISGYLYVVVAEWELTTLEASLLGSMRTGN